MTAGSINELHVLPLCVESDIQFTPPQKGTRWIRGMWISTRKTIALNLHVVKFLNNKCNYTFHVSLFFIFVVVVVVVVVFTCIP